jgi:hypothetical protein
MNDRLSIPALTAGLLALVGLYGSFRVVTALASVDPDSSHSLILWFGITEHGWAWLQDWRFTQDNWLLSLFPWHFLGYALAGPSPLVALFGGWLIFVLAACLCGLLAWQLQAPRAAVLVPPVLLFLGLHAHVRGLVAYSTTHNITNLYGLCALFLVLRWLADRKPATLCGILLLLVAGTASDPWMVAAYDLPLAILAAILLVAGIGGIARRDSASLLAVALFASALTLTRLFGLLDFFPALEFQSGGAGAFVANFSLLLQELGGLVDIVPGYDDGRLIPAVLSLLAVAGLLLSQLLKAYREGSLAMPAGPGFVIFSFFSIGGVTLAFVLNDSNSFSLSARFLINVPYLVVTGLGVLLDLNRRSLAKSQRGFAAALLLLFLAAGATSTSPAWSRPAQGFGTERVAGLIAFLRSENLTYGYGPYWGGNANAVTAASGQTVIMRPVSFDPLTGMLANTWRPQTSRRWYRSADIPAGQREFFVLVSADGEECADVALCVAGLGRQFGPPVRTLDYDGRAAVLVWDRPLTDAWR